jgi:two-component system, cell cycle sensor histidine kinase and response regulator CckA
MAALPGSRATLSILVVEDEKDTCEFLARMMAIKFQDSVIYQAEDGQSGLKLFKEHLPDLVITDIDMPVMNGIRLAEEIRALNPGAKIIAVSAKHDTCYLLDAIKVGINRYVLKPLDIDLLFEAMEDCISNVNLNRQIKAQNDFIRKLSLAVEQSTDMMVIANSSGAVEYVNPMFHEITGYASEEVTGQQLRDLLSDPKTPDAFEMPWRTITRGLRWHGEIVLHKKSGELFYVEASISPLATEGHNTHYVAVLQDISERRQAESEKARLENQLQHAQKMDSVGRLAGGVAHDFNNMLGVILGHVNLALMDLEPTQPLYVNMVEIQKAAERSADLTRQLLAFARKQAITPKTVNVNEAVAGMLKMLQRIIGDGITLDWQPEKDPWPVRVDPSQLDQILANLCVNARDALADSGKITIETGNSVIDEDYLSDYQGFAPGEYVRLTVSDNGCGMDKETLDLIFEPFFTTKGTGKGTGLGLATVYGAVRQNDGFIYVHSEPGLGTTFSVFLPRYLGNEQKALEDSVESPARGGHETILLVEDESAILKVASLILRRQGYTVLEADSPSSALDLAREHAGDISLLLTDVVMPGMNGRELAKELLSRYPHLKRLFMSGFTADVIANHGAIDPEVHFIQKPFSAKTLAAKVREVLDLDE